MTLKINYQFFVCLSFMGIVLSSSQAIVQFGLDKPLQYISYFLLIVCILISLLKNSSEIVLRRVFYFVFISFLFTLGISLQNLSIPRKIYLSFSMLIISSLATLPISVVNYVDELRRISYYLLYGVLFSTILGVIFRVQLLTIAVEGIGIGFGFNGGVTHKNFFAITVFASYMLLVISRKYGRRYQIDFLILILDIVLLLVSNTRSIYLLLAVFLGIMNIDWFLKIKKKQRQIMFIVIIPLSFILSSVFFDYIVANSGSYTHRVQGVINLFNYYKNDYFHLFFGDAELAFGNSEIDYGYKIRSVIGWNGTVEMPLLSVMIKNGYVGLIGYILVLLKFVKDVNLVKVTYIKRIGLSILAPLLLSAIVENYIVNINFVFMPVCFTILCSIKNMEKRNQLEIL